MLAALLGAIVGGLFTARVGSRQNAKVLEHQTNLAVTERREAHGIDEDRRRSFAADQLIAALADFTTVKLDDRDHAASFARLPATRDVHGEGNGRALALQQAGSSHAHSLAAEVRERWDALSWMVRFNRSERPEHLEDLRRRDANDLLNYAEYVR